MGGQARGLVLQPSMQARHRHRRPLTWPCFIGFSLIRGGSTPPESYEDFMGVFPCSTRTHAGLKPTPSACRISATQQNRGIRMRVAVIGTGIAGNAAAWSLSKRYPVTVY